VHRPRDSINTSQRTRCLLADVLGGQGRGSSARCPGSERSRTRPSGEKILLINLLTKLATIRPTVRLVASFVLSAVLLAYVASPLPGGYIAVYLVLFILYLNLVLMRLYQASLRAEAVRQAVEAERAAWQAELASERAQRIAAFARRDSSGELPKRCLMILAIPRSGSTWLMDILRSLPCIHLEPSAIVFEQLGLNGNRYPRGLSDGPDSKTDLEVKPGLGARVPDFSLPPATLGAAAICQDQSYALEKLHPEFFDFDTEGFLGRIDLLRKDRKMNTTFIYQIREPLGALTSFLNYQKRDPSWYRDLPASEVPRFMERTYSALLEVARRQDGIVVDYADLVAGSRKTLLLLFAGLWPDADTAVLAHVAAAALEVTARGKRVATHRTPFLGERAAAVRGDDELLQPFFSLHQQEIARCYEAYHALAGING
jgi:hypothetical protein